MSDTIETAAGPTPEELAAKRKVREDAINAKIAELKKCEGQWFARNDGTGLPTLVKKYSGIHVIGGIANYIFSVEIPSHAMWMPSATDFLAAHTLLDPQPETKPTATDLPR